MDAIERMLLEELRAGPSTMFCLVYAVDGLRGVHDPLLHDIPSAAPEVESALRSLVARGEVVDEGHYYSLAQRPR